MYLLAGIFAAGAAYLVNRYMVNRFGPSTIIFITPILEEVLKTGLAFYLRALLVPTHIVFGLIEGIYDLATSKVGILAGVLSLIWHTIFGLSTYWLAKLSGHIAYGLVGAILLHYLGNSIIILRPKENRQ